MESSAENEADKSHNGGDEDDPAKSSDDLSKKGNDEGVIVKKNGKIEDGAEIEWEQYFMTLAVASSARSKASKYGKKRVGACIVNDDNRVLALGFNGMPEGKQDNEENWDLVKSKYFECHAIINAILNRYQNDIKGCTVYVTHYPCSNCVRYMKQSGLKTVYYYHLGSCVDDPKDKELCKEWLDNAAKKYEDIEEHCVSQDTSNKRQDIQTMPAKFRSSDERLSWEQYFMGIALISAERSKDPKRQVGACIVNAKNRILAIGYNGMPDNIVDTDATWDPETKESFGTSSFLYKEYVKRNGLMKIQATASTEEIERAL